MDYLSDGAAREKRQSAAASYFNNILWLAENKDEGLIFPICWEDPSKCRMVRYHDVFHHVFHVKEFEDYGIVAFKRYLAEKIKRCKYVHRVCFSLINDGNPVSQSTSDTGKRFLERAKDIDDEILKFFNSKDSFNAYESLTLKRLYDDLIEKSTKEMYAYHEYRMGRKNREFDITDPLMNLHNLRLKIRELHTLTDPSLNSNSDDKVDGSCNENIAVMSHTYSSLCNLFNLMIYKPNYEAYDFGNNELNASLMSDLGGWYAQVDWRKVNINKPTGFNPTLALFKVDTFLTDFEMESFIDPRSSAKLRDLVEFMRKIPSKHIVIKVYDPKQMMDNMIIGGNEKQLENSYRTIEAESMRFFDNEVENLKRMKEYNRQTINDTVYEAFDNVFMSLDPQTILESFHEHTAPEIYEENHDILQIIGKCLQRMVMYPRLLAYGHRIQYKAPRIIDNKIENVEFEGWFGIFPFIGSYQEATDIMEKQAKLKDETPVDKANSTIKKVGIDSRGFYTVLVDAVDQKETEENCKTTVIDTPQFKDAVRQIRILNDELSIINNGISKQTHLVSDSRVFFLDFNKSFSFDPYDYAYKLGYFGKTSFSCHPMKIDEERFRELYKKTSDNHYELK